MTACLGSKNDMGNLYRERLIYPGIIDTKTNLTVNPESGFGARNHGTPQGAGNDPGFSGFMQSNAKVKFTILINPAMDITVIQ